MSSKSQNTSTYEMRLLLERAVLISELDWKPISLFQNAPSPILKTNKNNARTNLPKKEAVEKRNAKVFHWLKMLEKINVSLTFCSKTHVRCHNTNI
jgi:hypothetical protein